MSDRNLDVVVVGAGMCGLSLAAGVSRRGRPTRVLEKSRGVGGRLATRRTERARFDHGAQFYVRRPESAGVHDRWAKAGLVREWWTEDESTRFNAPSGMTVLAKELARDLDVRLGERVIRLERRDERWLAHGEGGAVHDALTLVLTCPVPQVIALLNVSDLAVPENLARVVYAPALVVLVEEPRGSLDLPGATGYRTDLGSDVKSIADQHLKQVSATPAWTITMSPEFSRKNLDDPAALEACLARVKALAPNFSCARAELKVWRYAQPATWGPELSVEVAPGLHLAGDGFGGPSVNGALRSAAAVLNRIVLAER